MFGGDDVPDGAEEHADFLHGAWLEEPLSSPTRAGCEKTPACPLRT